MVANLAAAALALAGCGELTDDDPVADDGPSVTESTEATEIPTATPRPTKKPKPSATTSNAAPTPAPSSPEADLSSPPTSYSEAAAHVNAAERAGDTLESDRFESPDGNFHCVLEHEFVRPSCEIGDRSIEDADLCAESVAGARYMGRIELTGRGWKPFCNSDTVREVGATKLPVGSAVAWPDAGITCVLEQIGLTCISGGNDGFFLGTGKYVVF